MQSILQPETCFTFEAPYGELLKLDIESGRFIRSYVNAIQPVVVPV